MKRARCRCGNPKCTYAQPLSDTRVLVREWWEVRDRSDDSLMTGYDTSAEAHAWIDGETDMRVVHVRRYRVAT